MERGMSLRMDHKLNQITVKPTNIQRTSAKLAMNVFHESTVAALKYYAKNGKAEFSDTYFFVNYLSNLLKIVNTRTSSVGKRKNDPLKLPISSVNDSRLSQLKEYSYFFETWKKSMQPGLINETFLAVSNVCHNIHNIIVYLIEKCNYKFVLTGHLQSDPLERRFGRYRQMSGGNFFISVKQIMESEKKMKIVALLRHSQIKMEDFNFEDENIVLGKDEFVNMDVSIDCDDIQTVQLWRKKNCK